MNEYFIKIGEKKINIIEDNLINPDLIILYVHGLGGHFQYVYNTCDEIINKYNFFSKFNLKLIAFEFEGHGKSSGERFVINDYNTMVSTLKIVIDYIVKKYNKKIVICAKSLGCAIVLNYLVNLNCDSNYSNHDNHIIGNIFIAPMCGISNDKLPNYIVTKLLLFFI